MTREIWPNLVFVTILCAALYGCAAAANIDLSFRDIVYYGWIPANIVQIFWTICDEKLKQKEASMLAVDTARSLIVGTLIIVVIAFGVYKHWLVTKPGEALDVIPIAMAVWLGLIFMMLGYAQLKKPKKEEVKKEE